MSETVKTASPSARHGFSLVELLVLICIVGLLAAVMLPALARGRAAARADECAAHLRRIGQAWETFADDHNGRGPGYAVNHLVSTLPHTWTSWLNHLVWGEQLLALDHYMRPVQRFHGWADEYNDDQNFSARPGEGNLACPEIGQWDSSLLRRPYIANWNATGGAIWIGTDGTSFGQGAITDGGPGPHGQVWRANPFPGSATLGTRLDDFRRPAMRFMIFEADRANDGAIYSQSERDLVADVNAEQRSTQHHGGIGSYMFRHPGLTMNALMMDGRVRRLANDPAQFEAERFDVQ
ncbi:MAG: hypothetical protein WD009_11105 [Phycisphaeraceae bacterium]